MNKKLLALLVLALVIISGFSLWWTYGRGVEPTKTPSASQTKKDTTKKTSKLKLYMIAYEDNGRTGAKIGCNDSAVEVIREITDNDPLTALYKDLLSLHNEAYGESGLHNTLAKSQLFVDSASIDAKGVARIFLTGTLSLAGECDNPRVQAQLEEPAKQFKGVKSVKVLINGEDLSKALSLK